MAVELYQRKNGLFALACFSIQPRAAEVISSSMVSIRFLVRGPVSLTVCLPTRPQRGSVVGSSLSVAKQCNTPLGPNLARNPGVLRIVGQFRLFFCVQVVKIAEELVESMDGRQEFIPIAKMVFPELASRVAERLEQFGDGRVFRLESDRGAGHADLGQARAEWVLAGNEGCSTCGAALLAVEVRESHSLFGDAVDVRRPVAHHAAAEVADVPDTDVVAQRIRMFGFFVAMLYPLF